MNLFGTALSLPVVMNILTGMAVGPRLVAYTSDLWENVSVGRTFLSAHFSDRRIVLILVRETNSGVGCCFGQTGMSAPP